ncbi:MAG: JAB domain-containing protein [Candidatus Galacturonibacter soehngenii]|nr:JAB domain-containing protein [Candidatus Galacturonibacter soehngenii]
MNFSTYRTMLDGTSKNVLVTENTFEYIGDSNFKTPLSIVEFMNNVFSMDMFAEEYVYMLAFNTKMKLLGVFEISHGTCNMSPLAPREVLIRALLCGAVNIILVHNHPSGICEPSKEDITLTKRMKEACEIVKIPLIDHIIIGDDYYSFKESSTLLN